MASSSFPAFGAGGSSFGRPFGWRRTRGDASDGRHNACRHRRSTTRGTGDSAANGGKTSTGNPGAKGSGTLRGPGRAAAVALVAAAGTAGVAFVAVAEERRSKQPAVKAGRSNAVAFFDLDHTILDCNSNKHWIVREVKAGKVSPKMILTAVYWFTRYAMGLGAGAESAGAEAAMLYAGTDEEELRRQVEEVFDNELALRMRPGCKPAMDAHNAAGVRCIICTSSWQYAAQYAAKLYNCETSPEDVISSVMAAENGALTGKIDKVAYGDGKYHVTKAWADANGVDLKECYFYSDSMSDVMLLEHVGHPVVVNPDKRLRAHAEARGWEIQDWGVSEFAKEAKAAKKVQMPKLSFQK